MTKLKGQSFWTEKLYGELGAKRMEKFAIETGLSRESSRRSLDAEILLKIIENSFEGHTDILEVGCGYGRIGKELLNNFRISYYGIDLNKPFIELFKKEIDESQRGRIFLGNFLDYEFPFRDVNCVLFPWSVIGDFSSGVGQIEALEKASLLLPNSPFSEGRVLIDIPKDKINKFEGYEPGYFNVHERYDLGKLGLKYLNTHKYLTLTGRNREIIELGVNR